MIPLVNQCRHNRRFIVAALLFVCFGLAHAFLVATKADASCGDYLLHGPMDYASTGRHGEQDIDLSSAAGALLHHGLNENVPLPERPKTPCAGGRCQATPPLPPPNSPTRAVYIKQHIALQSFGDLACDKDARDWRYPVDGLSPESPSLAVDLPPPKRVF